MGIKAIIYRIYFWYFRHFPIDQGKTFIGKAIFKLLGETVFTIRGLKFLLSPAGFIDKHLLYTGEYDGQITREINKSLQNGGTFIDVGANFGYYSIWAASLNNTNVISFEPSPREVKRLRENIRLNDLTNVRVFDVALSDQSQELYLNISGIGNTGMNTFLDDPRTESKVLVACKRMDEVLNSNNLIECRLIKIDVEGFEFEVLKGMGDLLNDYTGKLIVEMNYEDNAESRMRVNEIYEYLNIRGFQPKFGSFHSAHYNEIFTKTNGQPIRGERSKILHCGWYRDS